MANISFKLGSLDLSNYVRVNPENKMNPSPGDVFEPAFSDSPLFEGQLLTSIHAKNKEMSWPLFVHNAGAGAAPVTNLAQNPCLEWDQVGQPPAWWTNNSGDPNMKMTVVQGSQKGGQNSLRVFHSKASSGAAQITSSTANKIPVTPGATYTFGFSAFINQIVGTQGHFGPVARIVWYDSNGTSITNSDSGTLASPAVAGTRYDKSVTATAPNNAAYATLVWFSDFTTAYTIDLNLDAFMFVAGSQLPAYGDGDYAGWEWAGTPGNSISYNLTNNQDALNQLIQLINDQLRPIVDLGQPILCQWQNAQASNPTFHTVQFGRFEPDFNFRQTEKGWLAGVLRLWVIPYGHTATERAAGSWAAPTYQSGMLVPAASIVGGALSTLPGAVATNMVPNPSGEYDAAGAQPAGWNPSTNFLNQGGSVVAAATRAWRGTNAFKITCATSFSGAGVFMQGPFYPNVTYCLQAILSGASGGENPQMGLVTSAGGDGVTPNVGAIGTSPALYSMMWTPSQVQATAIALIRGASQTLYADQLIVSAPSSSYFDGDTPKAFWAGTPGNSYSVLTPTQGLSVAGDVPPQFDLRVTVGSYLGDDGRLGIISALPVPSYSPIIPVGSFIGKSPSAAIYGASGAWASQFLAMDNIGGSQGAAVAATQSGLSWFSFALSPASVYAGDNRVLGLTRARLNPFGLRAFDPVGNPLGPTVIATAMDGWQIVDYGVLRLPPWMGTAIVNVQAYSNIPPSASGMFAPQRAAPGWTQEHGPIFVVPNGNTIMGFDWNSPALSIDGFDQASGVSLASDGIRVGGAQTQTDQLGNAWFALLAAGANAVSPVSIGSSVVGYPVGTSNYMAGAAIGSIVGGDLEVETTFSVSGPTAGVLVGRAQGSFNASYGDWAGFCISGFGILASAGWALSIGHNGTFIASMALPSLANGRYHLKFVHRGSQMTALLGTPSGVWSGAASGALASIGAIVPPASYPQAPFFQFGASGGIIAVEAFRARALPSQGIQSRDILHLHQPNQQHTRMTPSAIDAADLQARQRGPLGAVALPVPSLGAGVFAASFPWDQGPANDLLNVDIRVRERFSYAR